jgi:hypothetical protein
MEVGYFVVNPSESEQHVSHPPSDHPPALFRTPTLSNIHESTYCQIQMDGREFSSPVCYIDYDHETPAAKPVQPNFCIACTAFISSLYTASTQKNEAKLEALSTEDKLNFVMNQEVWVYKSKGNIVETAAKGCPLCAAIVGDLSQEYRERLTAREELEVRKGKGTIFDLGGAVKE